MIEIDDALSITHELAQNTDVEVLERSWNLDWKVKRRWVEKTKLEQKEAILVLLWYEIEVGNERTSLGYALLLSLPKFQDQGSSIEITFIAS